MKANIKTIVITWTDMDGLYKTDKYHRPDGINWFPVFEHCRTAKACVWLNKGNSTDLARAQVYADSIKEDHEKVMVFTFRPSDKKVFEKAKQMILDTFGSETS